jgi:hypothetical protein
MNPMNLLTTGRTILGLKEKPGRYKLGGGAVPNFSKPQAPAPEVGPVPTTPQPEAPSTQTALFEPSKSRKGRETAVAVKAASAIPAVPPAVNKPKAHPFAAAPAADEQVEVKPGFLSEVLGWVKKWMPTRKSLASPLESFQTELALEKVKVVRNDLSEDDMEVVMIDRKVGKKAKPASERVDLEKTAAVHE